MRKGRPGRFRPNRALPSALWYATEGPGGRSSRPATRRSADLSSWRLFRCSWAGRRYSASERDGGARAK